ncbi:MAG: hypothetical protein QNJ30_21145 [Kiloniellales bacterium]|nr:hypothetical protein [Kiloniellales bacterium]
MPYPKPTLIALIGATMLFNGPPASAETAEKLTGQQVEGYLKGNTVYVDIVPDGPFGKGGLSPFYYGHDGRFAARMPNGRISGSWKLSDTASYCIDIVEHGKTYCTDVFKTPTAIEHHSVGLKTLMGPVRRIVPGNDADL